MPRQAKNKKVAKKETKPKIPSKTPVKKLGALSAPLFDLSGATKGTVDLPKDFFGQKINDDLLTQAIRVYQTNQLVHSAATKTRGEVKGGGKKPWRQKGTGRARSGSIRSPLWVGGGIALGPRPRQVRLDLPKKMKNKALIFALSSKQKDRQIKIISNLENVEPKTKLIGNLTQKINLTDQKILLVVSAKNQNLKLASRNIPEISVDLVENLNAFEILKNKEILFSKEALAKLS